MNPPPPTPLLLPSVAPGYFHSSHGSPPDERYTDRYTSPAANPSATPANTPRPNGRTNRLRRTTHPSPMAHSRVTNSSRFNSVRASATQAAAAAASLPWRADWPASFAAD